jgi:hypothetical protein
MKARLPVLLSALLVLSAAHCSAAESGRGYAAIGPVEVLGDGPHFLDAGIGLSNWSNKGGKRSNAGRIEARIGKKLAFAGPAIGLIANGDDSRYGYAGIYADFAYGKFVVTPVLAAGVYRRGNGIDLGGSLEFRESLEIAYRIADRWRAGVSLAHVSNAGIHEQNPGQQDLFVTCAMGF